MAPEAPTQEAESTETEPKKTSKPKATPKAAAKKATKKAETNGHRGPTIRSRVFGLLKKNENGLTGAQIQEKLELSGIPSLLKDEAISPKPRIKRTEQEGVRGVVYVLTALGRKHAEEGKVDEHAAEKSGGKEFPNGR